MMDQPLAWPERIVEARRQWLEVRPEDFERVGRRRWRDLGAGRVPRIRRDKPALCRATVLNGWSGASQPRRPSTACL